MKDDLHLTAKSPEFGCAEFGEGLAVEGEGLHDAVLGHLVEAAVEAVLLAVAPGDVAPAAAGGGVPVDDPGLHSVGPDPSCEQLGVGVGPHELGRGRREVSGDADDGYGGVGLDAGLGDGGHDASPSLAGARFGSFISARTASRRR